MRWEHVAWVASDSHPGEQHEVKRERASGRFGCDCGKYRFAKKVAKTCHHIEAYLAGELMDSARAVKPSVRAESVRVTRGAETFTVRRGITFGRVGA